MTVSVPSVDSAYTAESTDGTLTKSATKTVLFQYSKIQNIPISGAGAAGAVFRDTRRDPPASSPDPTEQLRTWTPLLSVA